MTFKSVNELKSKALSQLKDVKMSVMKTIDYKNPSSEEITKKMEDPSNRYANPDHQLPDVNIPSFDSELAPVVREAINKHPLPPLPKLSEFLKDEN